MKIRISILIYFLLFCTVIAAQTDLTLMSYNIRNGRGMDDIIDLTRTAKVINHVKPTIIALQEVDSITQRHPQDIAKVLGGMVDMKHFYGPSIDLQGGKYGVAILSREEPISTKHLALPGREEARSFLLLEFDEYVFICTHLSLTEEDRYKSISIINEQVVEYANKGKAVFVTGDLNDEPDSRMIQFLQKDYNILSDDSVPTYPADKPNQTLDYILSYKTTIPINATFSYVYKEALASDHRPIVVGVRIGK